MEFKKTNPNYPNEVIRRDMQQPLTPSGKINENFNKIYGKDKNPWKGMNQSRGFHGVPETAPWLVGEPNSPERLKAIELWEKKSK